MLKGIEIDPRLTVAYVELAKVYAATGNYDQGIRKLEEAIKLEPGNTRLYMLSGVLYQKKGDLPKAREAYEKAVEVDPNFAPALNNLAYIYSKQPGERERALKLARRANQLRSRRS